MARSPRFVFEPARPENWKALCALFGERGACAGCWCMYLRRPAKQYEAGKGPSNRRALKRVIDAGREPGVLAFDHERAVGWCAIAPRSEYVRLENSRINAPIDDQQVWSITCLFVDREYRRRGLSVQLVRAACRHARRHGAHIVEAYPHDEAQILPYDAFLWSGHLSAFRANGFVEVARRSPKRPIVRRMWKR